SARRSVCASISKMYFRTASAWSSPQAARALVMKRPTISSGLAGITSSRARSITAPARHSRALSTVAGVKSVKPTASASRTSWSAKAGGGEEDAAIAVSLWPQHGHAGIDLEGDAADGAAGVRGEEHGGRGHLFRCREAAQ